MLADDALMPKNTLILNFHAMQERFLTFALSFNYAFY